MNKTSLTDEQKELFEKEYREFLVEKIRSAGGNIQFQHLIGLLSQLKFDVKQAVGCTKFQLMKFLKSNSSTFKIDNKGVVSTSEFTTVDNDLSEKENVCKNSQGFLPPDIKNGKGKIASLFPVFGFIDAYYPFKTSVYFTAAEISDEKNKLLTDFDIITGCKVCFNAAIGLNDYEAPYCAIKVWKDYDDEDENYEKIDPKRKLNENASKKASQLNDVGVIEKICHDIGYVVINNYKQPMVFNKSHIDSDIEDLTKIFSKGETVEIVANKIIKQGQPQWQIIRVQKKIRERYRGNVEKESTLQLKTKCDDGSWSSARDHNYHSSSNAKMQHSVKKSKKHKEMIKDQRGKINLHSDGVHIMFGDKFSQKADGSTSFYFLYGSQVNNSEISWEFSDGDDIYFDAVKTKSAPGWKAVIVWAGEKPDFVLPTCMGDFSEFTDEETDELNHTSKPQLSSSKMANLSPTSEMHLKKQNKRKVERNNFEVDSTSSNSSTISNKEIPKCNFNLDTPEISKKKNLLKFSKKKYKKGGYEKNTCVKNDLPIKNENESFLDCNKALSELNSKVSDVDSNEKLVSYNNINCEKDSIKVKRPRIKIFENIEGKVLKVFCKYVIVENCELREHLSLFLNNFYFDGLSADEQFYNNLIDIINEGEIVKFNCFEIIDDSDVFHPIVTVAWKGIKPQIEEVTPEDVIQMYKLSVTLDDNPLLDCHVKEQYNLQTPCVKTQNNSPKKFLSVMNRDSDATDDEFSEESTNNVNQLICVTKSTNSFLSQIISEKLKSCGTYFSDSRVDLNDLSTEIVNLVLKHDNSKQSNISPLMQKTQHAKYGKETADYLCPVCSSYSKVPKEGATTNHKEVQTIVTGEIIAKRHEFSFARQSFAS